MPIFKHDFFPYALAKGKNMSLSRSINFNNRTDFKILVSLLFVTLANFLFFKSPIGSTIGLFSILLFSAIWYFQPSLHKTSNTRLFAISCLISAASMIEVPNTFQFLFFLFLSFVLVITPKIRKNIAIPRIIMVLLGQFFTFWTRLMIDAKRILKISNKGKNKGFNIGNIFQLLILPIVFGAVFIIMFYNANPILANALDKIDISIIFKAISLERIIFSLFTLSIVWYFIRPQIKSNFFKENIIETKNEHNNPFYNYVFNEKSVFISLLLFNVIFAIQNILDLTFLWSGNTLPDGLTHAQYAHRGAYPLIFTTLLAAWFVLFGLKNSDGDNKSKWLVYFWIAQNIFLVTSSILRTINYIDVYSLTYLRVAALIWMGLVALGLFLIIVKIQFKKDNMWLINKNFTALIATILVCNFINFGSIIAWHNIKHCAEISGKNYKLDINYLSQIGVESLPASIWALSQIDNNPNNLEFKKLLEANVANMKSELALNTGDWRSITFRQYRLSNEIAEFK